MKTENQIRKRLLDNQKLAKEAKKDLFHYQKYAIILMKIKLLKWVLNESE